jgi:hypothetical protein
MQPSVFVSAALAFAILATPARASLSIWSPDSGQGANETRLSVFGAYALPTGNFGSTSVAMAGYAMPGAGLGLDISTRYSRGIEVGAVVLVERNPMDTGALGTSLAAFLRASGLPSEPLVVSATEWQTGWGFLKVGYAPRVGAQLRAAIDVYGGALLGTFPEVRLAAAPPGIFLHQRAETWVGLATGAGAGLRWRDHLAIGLLYLVGPSHRNSSWGTTPRQPVSTLHATLGYTFGQ